MSEPQLRTLLFRADEQVNSPVSVEAFAVYSYGTGAAPVLERTVRTREFIVSEDAFGHVSFRSFGARVSERSLS